MASVLAIVSKAMFEGIVKERADGAPRLGMQLGIDRYTSTHKALEPLRAGGALFLVTVRPPSEALWLVAILETPVLGRDGWSAPASAVAIADVSKLKGALKFASGTGITAKPGALGMSLQTPRALTDADVALLRRAAGSVVEVKPAAKKNVPAAKAAKAGKAPAKMKMKTTATASADLDGVRAAIDAGDAPAALHAALDAWRAVRTPALADLVDATASRFTLPAIASDREWSMVAGAKNPVDVARLVTALPEMPVSFFPAAGALLAAFPDDPRIAMAIATWALDPPTTSSSTYPFWAKTLDTLARTGDARVLPVIAKRLKMPQAKSGSKYTTPGSGGVSQFWPKFYAALAKTAAKLDAAVAARAPAPADAKGVGALAKAATQLTHVTAAGAAPARAITAAPTSAAAPTLDGPPLAQAAAHLAAGRVLAALDAMLDAWRALRSPETADLIDRATRLLPAFDQPLPVEPKAAHEAWLAAFADAPMAALPRLLHDINAGGSAAAERHLVELAALPDDPRVALRLAEIVAFFGISPERTQYWKSLFEILARVQDVRTAAPLRASFRNFTGTYYNHHRQARRIIGPFALGPATPPPLDSTTLGHQRRIAAELVKLEAKRDRTEADLLAAIAAEWSDDAPRLVYADWLTDRGHPRGEAIVLSCKAARGALSPAEAKRQDIVQAGHIFGALSDVDYTLDRGLPVSVTVTYRGSPLSWRKLPDEPLLRFVERIDFEGSATEPFAADLARVMLAPSAARLATLADVPNEPPSLFCDALAPLLGTTWTRTGDTFRRA